MSSSDRLSPQQLQMFMPARELMDKFNINEAMDYMEVDGGKEYNDFSSTWEDANDEDWRMEGMQQLKDRKLNETLDPEGWRPELGEDDPQHPWYKNNEESLYESIAREGVTEPVTLQDPNIMHQGHHRVAAAYSIDPDMEIPVKHNYGPWAR